MNFLSIEHEKYFWRPLVTDMLSGAAAVAAMIPVGLRLGGFSFMLPWAIVTPLALFLGGFLRGSSPHNAWAKAVAIDVPILLLIFFGLGVNDATVLHIAAEKLAIGLAAVLSTAGGIWLRRHNINRVRNGDIDNLR